MLTNLAKVYLTKRATPAEPTFDRAAPLLTEHVVAQLSAVNDVEYLRGAQVAWAGWARANNHPAPSFNWVSIFNFHVAPTSEALVLSVHYEQAQALMLARPGHVVRCDRERHSALVYIGFIEVAPWNAPAAPFRHFVGLGSSMLRAACDLSMQRGTRGRIGLHSIAAAEPFYRRLGFRVLDCSNEYNELYMELDEVAAAALLAD